MGLMFAAGAAISYAVMTIFARIGGQRAGDDNGVIAALIVNVVLHGLVVTGRVVAGSEGDWQATGVAWFVVSGVLTTLLGRMALYAGIERVGSARAAPIKNLAPFVTVVMAVVLLGERPTPVATTGIVLALASYGIFIWEGLREGAPLPQTAVALPVAAGAAGAGASETSAPRMSARFGIAPRFLGYAACTLAATFYGVGTIVRKVGVEAMPDPFVAAWISATSGLVVYAVYLRSRGQLRGAVTAVVNERQPYFWLAGLASSVGQLALFVALSLTAASVVSVVSASDTILTLALAAVFLGRTEAINRWVVIAAAGVFLGTLVMSLG